MTLNEVRDSVSRTYLKSLRGKGAVVDGKERPLEECAIALGAGANALLMTFMREECGGVLITKPIPSPNFVYMGMAVILDDSLSGVEAKVVQVPGSDSSRAA